jgi:hypothetical protein
MIEIDAVIAIAMLCVLLRVWLRKEPEVETKLLEYPVYDDIRGLRNRSERAEDWLNGLGI